MTLIRNLPAVVVVSGSDLLPLEDTSEQVTKRVTVNQLVSSVASIALFGIEVQTVSSSGAAITDPDVGKIKLVLLNVAGDQQYTGLPTPSNSGIIYILKLTQEGRAWFDVAIDGVGPGAPDDPDEDNTVWLSAIGERIMIVDLGTYVVI